MGIFGGGLEWAMSEWGGCGIECTLCRSGVGWVRVGRSVVVEIEYAGVGWGVLEWAGVGWVGCGSEWAIVGWGGCGLEWVLGGRVGMRGRGVCFRSGHDDPAFMSRRSRHSCKLFLKQSGGGSEKKLRRYRPRIRCKIYSKHF